MDRLTLERDRQAGKNNNKWAHDQEIRTDSVNDLTDHAQACHPASFDQVLAVIS